MGCPGWVPPNRTGQWVPPNRTKSPEVSPGISPVGRGYPAKSGTKGLWISLKRISEAAKRRSALPVISPEIVRWAHLHRPLDREALKDGWKAQQRAELYPPTKGSAGGKLPTGNRAPRSPFRSFS